MDIEMFIFLVNLEALLIEMLMLSSTIFLQHQSVMNKEKEPMLLFQFMALEYESLPWFRLSTCQEGGQIANPHLLLDQRILKASSGFFSIAQIIADITFSDQRFTRWFDGITCVGREIPLLYSSFPLIDFAHLSI